MPGAMELMEASIPGLRRYASALLRNRQEVDDLVHDCLVRALDQIHTRRSDTEMRSWLFAIMHNLFVSRIRKQSVRGRMQTVEEVREETLGVDGGQERHMQLRDVVRALDALPEEQRSVLVLVSVEDLSYAEVATVLGIPTGTVMSRLVRGRERLRQMVEGAPGALRRRVR